MSNDNVTRLIQPGFFDDQLTEILRNGARALLAKAVEVEVADFLDKHADLKTQDGHQRVVRHGHLPEREVMTGIGPVTVHQPRVRDRTAAAGDPGRIRFSPSILPPYMRRSKSIETLLPILYLKGISTGDFSEALAALLGNDAAGLSASAIGRLKDGWFDEHAAWQKRDLSAKRYVYIWADGIHLEARLEDEKQCILVLIGATPEGRKELVGFTDGARESAHDWRDLLLDLKRRGLDASPRLVIADGALGFWKAAGEVWPKTREQRCWVHKTANVLAKLPKSQQPKAKRALQEIWMAETKAAAELAFEAFIESYALKYDKAADCLAKDRDTLLAFYDFPAEHWKHLRTTDEIDKQFLAGSGGCILLFDRAAGILPSRPPFSQLPRAGAVKAGRSLRPPQGSALTGPSTAASSIGSGLESNNDSPAQCPRGMGTSPNGDCYCRARVTSWRRAARRLQASPGSPICVLPG